MKTLQQLHNLFSTHKVNSFEPDFYTQSYPTYLSFFSDKKQLTEQDVIIGLGLVYSWMPTIPKNINFDYINQILPIVNKAKLGAALIAPEYSILKKYCNNSLVGTSKLLHFINPEKFAIWDSKIYSFIYQDSAPHKYKIEDIDKYIAYLNLLNQISSSANFKTIIQQTKKQFTYPISNFRAMEWLFFTHNLI